MRGFAWWATASASLPEAASATTVNSESSSMLRTPPRQIAWSSTSSTGITGVPLDEGRVDPLMLLSLAASPLPPGNGKDGPDGRTLAGHAPNVEGSVQQCNTLSHALQADVVGLRAVGVAHEPAAPVLHLEKQVPVTGRGAFFESQLDPDPR